MAAGLLTFGAGREAGGVVHNRELEILDFFSPSRNYPVSEDRYKYVG